MRLKKARQILKTFADDTRLRIINLLNYEELSVTEICNVLKKNQPNISKHLAKLRLTGVVSDRRDGLNVFYYLRKPETKPYKELLYAITDGLSDIDVFKSDIERVKSLRQKSKP